MKIMNQYESKFIDKENFKNINTSSLAKIPQGPIENLINNLQERLRINFGSPKEAFQFFDILTQEKVSI